MPNNLKPKFSLLSVIIPVYNEEKTVKKVVERVREVEVPKQIVIVDDGSTDSTPQVLEEIKNSFSPDNYNKKITILRKDNGGKGSAIKEGIKAAEGEIVIFQDADLEYDPQDYHIVIKPILNGEADAVLGSRLLKKQDLWVREGNWFVYFRNHLGIRLITLLTNWLYWYKATDYEGCYKAFYRTSLLQIPIEAQGFEYDNELVCKAFRLGLRFKEVPISYRPRSYREGKKIKFNHGMRMLWTIIKWRFAPFSVVKVDDEIKTV